MVQSCELKVVDADWPFARAHAAQIDAYWQRRSAENPAYFNGRIYMMGAHRIADGVLHGTLFPVEFKAFLYWKDHGAPDRSVRDAFGSALIRSDDGAVLLGRQRAGHLNAGLVYLPGGFIDDRDIANGAVDIRASVLREVEEETGLEARTLAVSEGFLVTTVGMHVSIAVELTGDGDAEVLLSRIREALGRQSDAELDEILAVKTVQDMDALPVPDFARALLAHVLRTRRSRSRGTA